MKLLNAPINDLEFQDVQDFVDRKIRENEYVEYKKEWPHQSMAKWLCAFANSNGGIILIGVETDSDERPTKICGIPNSLANPTSIDGESWNVYPPVFQLVEARPIPLPNQPTQSVFIIRVQTGLADVPYSANDTVYVRTNGSSRAVVDKNSNRVGGASVDEILRLVRRREMSVGIKDEMLATASRQADHHLRGSKVVREIIFVPVHPSPPKLNLKDFANAVNGCALTQSGHLGFSYPLRNNGTSRNNNGVGFVSEMQGYTECQREGLIYNGKSIHTKHGIYDMGMRNGSICIGLTTIQNDFFLHTAFAALLIKELELYCDYFVSIRLIGVRGAHSALGDNNFTGTQVATEELFASGVVPSVKLLDDAPNALWPILEEFLFPTGSDFSRFQEMFSRFSASSESRQAIIKNGQWVSMF